MAVTFTLKNSARLALAISAAFPFFVHAASAGRVDFVVGNAMALGADGRSRPLSKGGNVESGETISTNEGRVQVRFTDGAQVSLQPGTQYRVDDYAFSGRNDGQEKGFFSLLKGSFRTVTGLIGKADRKAYKVNTSTATIGIRGTEFLVSESNGVTVSTGEGSVEVCNQVGCVILTAGESAYVKSNTSTPLRIINLGANTTNDKPDTPSVKIEYEKINEGLGASLPKAAGGAGYAMAASGTYYDSSEGPYFYAYRASHDSGTATFGGSGELESFTSLADSSTAHSFPSQCSYDPCSYLAQIPGGALSDGIVTWGRWSESLYSDDDTVIELQRNVHYVTGQPTPAATMLSLASDYQTGTYALMGYTLPTSTNSSTGATIVGTGGMTGSLVASFGLGQVSVNLANINVGGSSYAITNGIASINNATAQFGGSACCGSIAFNGYFFGANAARAGLVYHMSSNGNSINGAAAFSQTALQGYSSPPL
jgi:hypothetical protein